MSLGDMYQAQIDAEDAARYRRIRDATSKHPEAFIAIRGVGTVAISQLTGKAADEWIDRLLREADQPGESR